MQRPSSIVHHVQLIVVIGSETNHLQRRINQFFKPGHFLAVMPYSPDLPGHIVGIDVSTFELLETIPHVDSATGNRTGLGMGMRHRSRDDLRRTLLPLGVDRLTGLDDAPPVISSFFYTVNHLPHFPTHVTTPECTIGRVKSNFPGIAKTIGPDFAARPWLFYKRIIFGNRIKLTFLVVIDIDSHNRRHQCAQVLSVA